MNQVLSVQSEFPTMGKRSTPVKEELEREAAAKRQREAAELLES